MAAKSFGELTPDTVGGKSPDPGIPTEPRRERTPRVFFSRGRLALTAAIVLIAATLIVVSGGDNSPSDKPSTQWTVRAAHGPTRVVDNVPAGYTRDREGAATAAVNAVQALTQGGQGRIDMRKVVDVLVATNPGAELRKSIDISRDRARDEDVLNVLPAAVTVVTQTADTAEVSVWTMGIARASITPGDPVSVTTVWSTHTVSLVWEHDDWKVVEKSGRIGPTPDEVVAPNSNSPLVKPLMGGYYTFYVS